MPGIEEWIEKQLKAGYSEEKIKEALIKSGYNPNLLEEIVNKNLIKEKTKFKSMPKSPNNVSYLLVVIAIILALMIGALSTFFFIKNTRIDNTKILKYEDILAKNPNLAVYTKSPNCIENVGFVYFSPHLATANKARVSILTFNDEIIGIISAWPASEGWFPHADQPEDNPINIRDIPSYTQAIYFKDPPTAEDCAIATGE